MKLPPQAWTQHAGAKRIFAALDVGQGMTRIVGGAVRDALLGLPVADVDLATRFRPEEVIARLEAAGLKAVPTGIAHGTVTAIASGFPIEVTTLRRDVATDGRHAVIAYTDDWREDAARRDFTINALYADPISGELYDYFGGLDDLAARRVRFIGEPLQRIAEDHLRILRFFRFHARFGSGEPDPQGLEACTERANDLMALSRERVRDELLKLLCVADPVPTLKVMLDRGIFVPVLPEIGAARLDSLARLVAAEAALDLPCVALRRLAVLLPVDAELLDNIAARLRLSNTERKRLVALGERLTRLPDDIAPLAYRAGADGALDKLLLMQDCDAGVRTRLVEQLMQWRRPSLPLSGRDLIALGLVPGPVVSRTLQAVEEAWIAAGFPPDREATLALAGPLVAAAQAASERAK